MAIDNISGVGVATVGDLLEEDPRIPAYQRPYSWTPQHALALLDDIHREYSPTARPCDDPPTTYALGAVILHRSNNGTLDVVDGQQRLLTLTILLELLENRGTTSELMPKGALIHDRPNPIAKVWSALDGRIDRVVAEPGALAEYIRTGCLFIRIETDDVDEAFRVFDSQNYRGKALLPHDYLKAHHLRAMHKASSFEATGEEQAFSEPWDHIHEAELDRLFSTYLWRIHCWARGRDAPRFAPEHISVFKGISHQNPAAPHVLYHLLAQESCAVRGDIGSASDSRRLTGRVRFQLDAPITEGRPFFDMVDFMLDELRHVRRIGFDERRESFASSDQELTEISAKSKFRYVSELYIAALLYFVNKFGDTGPELNEATFQLFRWSFALRTRLLSVFTTSVDKLARGDADGDAKSAFVLLRNAIEAREIADLTPGKIGRDDRPAHMTELIELLRSEGT